MRSTTKMIATAACAIFLMSAFSLSAEEAAKPSVGVKGDPAVASSDASNAELPNTIPSAPIPSFSMGAASPNASGQNIGFPKAELFLGYSYLRAVPAPADGNRLMWMNGGSASIAFNFNRHLGLVADFGAYTNSQMRFTGAYTSTVNVNNANVAAFSYLLGPRLSFRNNDRITPFVQALFGGVHANQVSLTNCTFSCTLLPSQDSFAMTAGGGLDLKVHHHFAIRIIQAEYLMTKFASYTTGSTALQNDVRLSAGIVFRMGGNPAPQSVTLACSAGPTGIFPGDPVTVTATASDLDPKFNVVYTWAGVPGLNGNGTTASLDSAATASLAPGAYTVNCGVKEGRPGKEGLLPWESAAATASFTVKAFEPPTISCSASPITLNPGDKSVITAAAVSPQNRPLTYSYSTASGAVSGSGVSATYDSTGAQAGPVAITCNVSDDKGQTATASTSVTISSPPPPPPPAPPAEQVQLETRLALHSVFFPTDQPGAALPEGGLLASQEGTLTTLASDFKRYLTFKPDAHLTLTGHADVRGSAEYNQALSERRVARTKQFLVEEGVPEASIETQGLGKEQELTADQVKELVEQNPDLSDAERAKVLHDLNVIVLAQNRRVDLTLSSTGQQSVRLYPFNAADALTLIQEKSTTPRKKTAAPVKR
jgi:outer membrane protein OmpA-like peptidoglycan-associated protein/opacity protein-like surface antigen